MAERTTKLIHSMLQVKHAVNVVLLTKKSDV